MPNHSPSRALWSTNNVNKQPTRTQPCVIAKPYPNRTAHMLYYALKVVISALLIVAISEIAKRHTGLAALIASLPLTALLAFVWLHLESTPAARIADLSGQIFWLVLPSLALFLILPFLLRQGLGFWLSLGISMAVTVGCYLALLPIMRRFGVAL